MKGTAPKASRSAAHSASIGTPAAQYTMPPRTGAPASLRGAVNLVASPPTLAWVDWVIRVLKVIENTPSWCQSLEACRMKAGGNDS